MKITKACKNTDIKNCNNFSVPKDTTDVKTEACDHIKLAIDCLGKIASCDAVAKDSIANLGVVMLDLNS